jgi:hypothetical protein
MATASEWTRTCKSFIPRAGTLIERRTARRSAFQIGESWFRNMADGGAQFEHRGIGEPVVNEQPFLARLDQPRLAHACRCGDAFANDSPVSVASASTVRSLALTAPAVLAVRIADGSTHARELRVKAVLAVFVCRALFLKSRNH